MRKTTKENGTRSKVYQQKKSILSETKVYFPFVTRLAFWLRPAHKRAIVATVSGGVVAPPILPENTEGRRDANDADDAGCGDDEVKHLLVGSPATDNA